MMAKKDGSVSNENDYKNLKEKLHGNQAFFKDLSKKAQEVSKSNQEHIERMEEKSSSSGSKKP